MSEMQNNSKIDYTSVLATIEYDLDTYLMENVTFQDLEKSKQVLDVLHKTHKIVIRAFQQHGLLPRDKK